MRSSTMAGLLAVPALLAAWGSLRDIVTPLGYWAAWGIWALGAAGAMAHSWRPWQKGIRPTGWTVTAFVCLILGMAIAGGANQDSVTLYQASKVVVIAALCWVMWGLASRADAATLMRALYGVLALVTVAFFLSKAFSSVSYRLGSDREGDLFAYAGVLWKSGLFFLPLFMADWLCRPGYWVAAACAIGACLFLVVADGSRTGLLLIAAIFLGMAAALLWRGEWRRICQRPWVAPVALGVLLVLLLLNTGMNVSKQGLHLPAGGGASPVSRAEALLDRAIAPVVNSRLGEGDAPRERLLRNGLEKSRECFPLGCGFGSTAMDAGYGIPMNVHNAYLGALADFGLLGLLGMLGFLVAAVIPMRVLRKRDTDDPAHVYFVMAASGSALAYCVALGLHTFSTEMSEWGYLLLMLPFAWRPARVP